MPLTQSTISSKIDTIKKFVNDRASQTDDYLSIDRELEKLQATLTSTEKLKFQIVGANLDLAKALHKLLLGDVELQQLYNFKTNLLPEIPEAKPKPSAVLVLQSSAEVRSPISYELKTSQAHVIGRNPAVSQILLPNELTLSNGSHAELQPLVGGGWQIKDLDSRNGTFINDNSQRLQDSYILKPGDRISLGSDAKIAGSATLIFDIPSPSNEIDPAYTETQRLFDCNILCLVISPQPLSAAFKRSIELLKDAHISKLFVIVDRQGEINPNAVSENSVLAEIENFFKAQLPSIPFELSSLLLNPFIPNPDATVVVPNAQPAFEKLCDNLKSLDGKNADVILLKRGTSKLKQIVDRIEDILVRQDTALKKKLQNNEERFKELSENSLKKQFERNYRKVEVSRDSFFKQVKTELGQSKASLLDEFRKSSISYDIEQFSKELQPKISEEVGYRRIRLILSARHYTRGNSSKDVHAAAIELCHTKLTQWATTEWNRIRGEYVSGGLDAFFENSHELLNFTIDLVLSKEGFATSQILNIQPLLHVSTVQPTVDLRYKQVSFWSYILTSLRKDIMLIVGMGTLLGGALVQNNKANLIPCLVPVAATIAYFRYEHEKKEKIEDVSDKLQKEVEIYYQSYTKSLVDRIMQRIIGDLEAEERHFRETLENVKEIYASHLAEADKAQNQLKSELDEMKRSGQTKIEKDLIELRKLKQLI